MKKTLTYLCLVLFSFNASLSKAATASEVVASPVEALKKEQAELVDLRARLAEEERLHQNSKIWLGVSAASAVVGIIAFVAGGELDIATEGSIRGVMKTGLVLLVGGVGTGVGSTIYLGISGSKIKDLQGAIDKEIVKIDALSAELESK